VDEILIAAERKLGRHVRARQRRLLGLAAPQDPAGQRRDSRHRCLLR
jgi:hypothetical protein